jgi:hypothetical protein
VVHFLSDRQRLVLAGYIEKLPARITNAPLGIASEPRGLSSIFGDALRAALVIVIVLHLGGNADSHA